VIKTLKGKWAKKIWARNPSKQMLAIYEEALESLDLLDAITNWKDFAKIPGINLHPLHGNREGQWAFWIGKTKYRVCFIWGKDNHAYQVEIIDYHKN